RGGEGSYEHSTQGGSVILEVGISVKTCQVKVDQGPNGIGLPKEIVLFGNIAAGGNLEVVQVCNQGITPHDGLVTFAPDLKVGATLRFVPQGIYLYPTGTHYPWLDIVAPLVAHQLH